jgi:hypothetical protein
MEVVLSDAERVFIVHGVQEGHRTDGRRFSNCIHDLTESQFQFSS